MVIRVVRWDIEGSSELCVALEAETFVVAGQCLSFSYWSCFGGQAAHFLLEVLAGACYDNLSLAWFVFFTRIWRVAGFEANMAATWCGLCLSADMGALGKQSVLTVTSPMAWLLAGVNTTTKAVSTSLST